MGNSDDTPGRRAASYWFIDGVPEIISGVALAMLGGVGMWLSQRPLPWVDRVCLFGLLLLLLGILFGLDRRIAHFVKARVTYPRTGYVRPPIPVEQGGTEVVVSLGLGQQEPPDENVTAYLSHTVVVLLLGRFLFRLIDAPWGLPLAMSAVALAIYALNRNGERPYRWWAVLLLPAAGLASLALDPGVHLAQWLVLVIGGVWLSAQGAVRLRWYVRSTPRPSAVRGFPA